MESPHSNRWAWRLPWCDAIAKSLHNAHARHGGASINSIKPMDAKQKAVKKRSIHAVCEHFDLVFGAADAASADL
ncbi:MAG: hypothetical protein AB1717_00755 [Pseudomonadota bacterium]